MSERLNLAGQNPVSRSMMSLQRQIDRLRATRSPEMFTSNTTNGVSRRPSIKSSSGTKSPPQLEVREFKLCKIIDNGDGTVTKLDRWARFLASITYGRDDQGRLIDDLTGELIDESDLPELGPI